MRYRRRFDFGWIYALMGGAILALSSCGGGSGSANNNSPPLAPSPSLALLAGNVGGPGNVDGVGAAARFNYPVGIAIDGLGNLYVADTLNHTIRKLTPTGTVTTIAGFAGTPGSADGIGPAARFATPAGVALDATGNLYVGDWGNRIVRRISPVGVVTTLAGRVGECGGTNGSGASATFCFIEGIASDASGNVFVSSSSFIRKISPVGVVSTLAGTYLGFGFADGPGSTALFNTPSGIATDVSGNVYVADTMNYAIRRISPDGVVSTVAGMPGVPGSEDGIASSSRFFSPMGIGTDVAGNLYISDSGTTIRRISPAGIVTTIAGTAGKAGSKDGVGAAARLNVPKSVAADGAGNVYVTDSANHTIRRITPSGVVTTFAGSAEGAGNADGVGSAANFNAPEPIAVDSFGNVFVGDTGGPGFGGTIRGIFPSGVVTTLAGDASLGAASIDGIGRHAQFNRPRGLAIDKAGNTYVADLRCRVNTHSQMNEPCSGAIRRIAPDGTVSTLAGTVGNPGASDGLGAAASFSQPRGLAIDLAGNLYAADGGSCTIRKINPSGAVTTLAGLAWNCGAVDGIGSSARFHPDLAGIAVDAAGNVYVTDGKYITSDSYVRTIRRITPAGVVTTIDPGEAGRSSGSLAIDAEGNLYVADESNSTIRKRTPAGVVTTVVGVPGQSTFEPGPLPGRISAPRGLAISGTDLYFTLGNGVAVVHNRP